MPEANGQICRVIPGESDTGTPIFSALVKRTYTIVPGEAAVRIGQLAKFVETDQYFDEGDPQINSVRYETDLVPFKVATDIVVVGKAYAPSGTPAPTVMVALRVGQHRKDLLIIGDRRCEFRSGRPPVWSDPLLFTEMEIRYERAYGGTDERSLPGIPFPYPRNYIGRGFFISYIKENVDGLELPNIEDPADPLTPERLITGEVTRWNRQPLPQGLGWFHRVWYPRCSFLAAMPAFVPPGEVMQEEEFGIVPRKQADLAAAFRLPSRDPKFWNGASLGLAVPFLKGNEPVQLANLTRSGELDFYLPGEVPAVFLDIGMGEQELRPFLHSVAIRPDDNELDLVWRAAHPYPGFDWLPNMTAMRLRVN
jgi:hypothetical protein